MAMTLAKRNRLAAEFAPLLARVVRHMRKHTPRGIDTEDLHSIGWVSLLQALDLYRGDRCDGPDKLPRFLWYKVRFLMLDTLRAAECTRLVGGVPQFTVLAPGDAAHPATQHTQAFAREALDAVGALPERWQKLIRLYYFEGRTMTECGEVLGVNESRISQLHKAAITRLRKYLDVAGAGHPQNRKEAL